MRVTNKTVSEAVKYNLGNITEDLNNANMVVATQKRINSISDDPVGLTQVLNIKSSLSNIEQLERNITMGKSWLASTESALGSVQDLIADTEALSVQMVTASTGADARRNAATTVQNTLNELVSLANTDMNGRYIFAGSETDTSPFVQDGTYSGDSTAFTVKIGRNATVQVGSDGQDVFGTTGGTDDIFKTLTDLKTALENNDITGIRDQMTRLDAHFEQISNKISDVGSKMIRMEIKGKILQDVEITNTDRRSKIEDADIVESIMDLKAKEVAYQAALASAARVLNVSLVDYL